MSVNQRGWSPNTGCGWPGTPTPRSSTPCRPKRMSRCGWSSTEVRCRWISRHLLETSWILPPWYTLSMRWNCGRIHPTTGAGTSMFFSPSKRRQYGKNAGMDLTRHCGRWQVMIIGFSGVRARLWLVTDRTGDDCPAVSTQLACFLADLTRSLGLTDCFRKGKS
jgi:hypothetical protein